MIKIIKKGKIKTSLFILPFLHAKKSSLDRTIFFKSLEKYNFWESSPPLKGFFREKYISLLSENLGNSLVKVLLGQRRVGKSYILQQFIGELHTKNIPKENIFYLEYLQTGGLPEFFSLPTESLKSQYITNLKDSIILHDIVERHKIQDVSLLEDLFYFLIDNIGNLFSLNKIVEYISNTRQKTNPQTISQYLSFLEQAFLIHSVERYDIKGKKICTGHLFSHYRKSNRARI
ncbi:TPA: hypothetical protein EYP45_02120 [Candidatus Peregrinibacteria bacterium]|nr:hypothetical protein [Candidatus Peregrinibacteria bacterium]